MKEAMECPCPLIMRLVDHIIAMRNMIDEDELCIKEHKRWYHSVVERDIREAEDANGKNNPS